MTPHLSAASRWHTHTRIPAMLGLVLAAIFLLCGCDGNRAAPPDVAGPLHQAAPASGGVSAATEHSIADKANAEATGNKTAARAATVAINEQEKAEVRSDLHPFYWLSALAFVVAAILAYEGNMKLAAPVALAGVAAPIAAAFVAWVSDHRGLVLGLGGLGVVGALVWHYRARIEVKAQALEHAVATAAKSADGWILGHHPVQAVEQELSTVWAKVRAEAHTLAVKMHLAKAAMPVPTPPPTAATVTTSGESKPAQGA